LKKQKGSGEKLSSLDQWLGKDGQSVSSISDITIEPQRLEGSVLDASPDSSGSKIAQSIPLSISKQPEDMYVIIVSGKRVGDFVSVANAEDYARVRNWKNWTVERGVEKV